MAHFKTDIQVRFADIDMLGHVNNANFISYIEQARIAFFNHHIPTYDWTKAGIILARTEIDYIKPIHLKDSIEIQVTCSRVGTTSFDLSYKMYLKNQAKLCAQATTVMVCYDYQKKVKTLIPEHFKSFINLNA